MMFHILFLEFFLIFKVFDMRWTKYSGWINVKDPSAGVKFDMIISDVLLCFSSDSGWQGGWRPLLPNGCRAVDPTVHFGNRQLESEPSNEMFKSVWAQI